MDQSYSCLLFPSVPPIFSSWGLGGSSVLRQKFPHPSSPASLSKAGLVVEWGVEQWG